VQSARNRVSEVLAGRRDKLRGGKIEKAITQPAELQSIHEFEEWLCETERCSSSNKSGNNCFKESYPIFFGLNRCLTFLTL
jgi:hypothetical protein